MATIAEQMAANSKAWAAASLEEKTKLHEANVALAAGVGQTYTPSTGTWAAKTPPTDLEALMSLINQKQVAPPVYQKPDYSIIPVAQKGVAATANPNDTSFVPTSQYNDRVAQQKEAINAQAYNVYNANMGTYNAGQNASQQQMSNLANLLPYSTNTLAQNADITSNAASAAEAKRQFDLTYGLDKRQVDYALNKPYYAPSSGGSSSGSGGSSSGGSASSGGSTATSTLYGAMAKSGNALVYLTTHYKDYGLPAGQINAIYEDYLINGGGTPSSPQAKAPDSKTTVSNTTDSTGNTWVNVPGYGKLSWATVQTMVDSGKISEYYDKNTNTYKYSKQID